MISFPNGKINIGLNIVSKRKDGFHNIETVFYPIHLSDILEIVPAGKFSFVNTGIQTGSDYKENLVFKAFKLLKEKYSLPDVSIHLHKIIPMGAGLGGGSSDAVHTLLLLNELFDLKISKADLYLFADKLGSDCSFFIENKARFAFKKGNKFKKSNLSLKGYYMLLVCPGINVSTAEAYKMITPAKPEISLDKISEFDISEWKDHICNDFEKPVFARYPEIAGIKNKLYEMGAIYASMTGSGSSVYGLFNSEIKVPGLFKKYFCYTEILK